VKEDKTQRIRRTRNELKEATLRAVSELSKEKGLSRITMVDIGEKAGIRVDVLKRNYTSVEKILSLYAASVDYWISDLFTPKHPMATINEKVMTEVLTNLANALYNDSEMQKLLFWELSEDNPTTRRLAANRELFYADVFTRYNDLFKDTGLHIDIISALINAGIYYLILHRKRSTFWGVDFSKRPERKRFIEAIGQVITLVFNTLEQQKQTVEIARKLKLKGVALDVIAECTGLSNEFVKQL